VADELKQRFLNRLNSLSTEQSSWRLHWQELAEQLQPRRARFFDKDANKGDKRNDKIINNTPLISLRVAAAGMMAGLTSPARQWFRLVTGDPDLMDYAPVKNYIWRRERLMMSVIGKSNFYNTLAGAVYPDLLTFGTHAAFIEQDPEKILRLYPQAIGEHYLAANAQGRVDTLFRDIPMTVRQCVRKFGIQNVTATVKNMAEKGNYDQLIGVVHAVCPNEDYQQDVLHSYYGKKYGSYWFEKGSDEPGKFLRKAGYDRFPVLAPRWALTNSVSDVYGFSPGMDALGDCKELQHLERRKAMLVDKITNPTLGVPEEMKNQRISLVPGATVYIPRISNGAKVEPIQVIPPGALPALNELIGAVENRIAKGFYADLWMQMLNDTRQQPATAREIAERHEEKMLQLGPVVERAEEELLNPCLDWIYEEIDRRGLQEDPPPELQGTSLGVEYISVMAQAQRLVSVSATERFVSFALGLAQAKPAALDMLNEDVMVARMAATLGADPEFVKDQKQVDEERAARAAKEQAAQQGEAITKGLTAAKDASQTDTGKIQDLAQMVAGPVGASAAGFGPPSTLPMQ
jgi:hypothetical protein